MRTLSRVPRVYRCMASPRTSTGGVGGPVPGVGSAGLRTRWKSVWGIPASVRVTGRWAASVSIDQRRSIMMTLKHGQATERVAVMTSPASIFGRKTSAALRDHRRRAMKLHGEVSYTLEDLRAVCRSAVMLGRCFYCGGVLGEDWQLDHQRPMARGGLFTLKNLAVCCGRCNLIK